MTALTLTFAEIAVAGLSPGSFYNQTPVIGAVPRWVVIAVLFVAMDGCNWLAHLGNHRIRMLWRFHELHHSQRT